MLAAFFSRAPITLAPAPTRGTLKRFVIVGYLPSREYLKYSWGREEVIMSLEPEDLLAIGEVTRRTGVPASALHFYEQLGLIASTRSSGNQRRYRRHMLRRISIIVVAKRLGIPLSDVQEVFQSLPLDAPPSQRDWRRVAKSWRTQLEARRTQIDHLQRELTGCIGCGCLSLKACNLLNPEDALGVDGPGPRRI